MSWLQFIIFLSILGAVIKWVYKEIQEAKQARIDAIKDRKEMLQSIKKIEEEITDIDKVLHPIEKRHFR